jgi:hypothetical protein
MRRMLLTDGGMITGGVFLLIGGIFFVGGGGLCYWRYSHARQMVDLLRDGQAALGEITHVAQNYHVRVNGRYPWMIEYRFNVHGKNYQDKLSTLSQPDLSQQPGKVVYVLYQQDDPEKSTWYPSPYGYYGLDA